MCWERLFGSREQTEGIHCGFFTRSFWQAPSFSTSSLNSDSATIGVLYFPAPATLFHLFENSIDGTATRRSPLWVLSWWANRSKNSTFIP